MIYSRYWSSCGPSFTVLAFDPFRTIVLLSCRPTRPICQKTLHFPILQIHVGLCIIYIKFSRFLIYLWICRAYIWKLSSCNHTDPWVDLTFSCIVGLGSFNGSESGAAIPVHCLFGVQGETIGRRQAFQARGSIATCSFEHVFITAGTYNISECSISNHSLSCEIYWNYPHKPVSRPNI